MNILSLLFISYKLILFFSKFSYASDAISSSQSLSDGETLVSKGGTFELGFFSPGSSQNRYVGIWYRNIPVKTVVWVANRLSPINDSSGLLMINSSGNLVLMSQNKSIVWSPNSKTKVRSPMVMQLLDSGNLLLREEQDGNSGTYLWQSFDYPSDTLLPGMKLGWDLKTRFERRLSAWRSPDDPSPGDFTWGVALQDNPELVVRKGSEIFYRTGPWNGLGFSGSALRSNELFQYNFVSHEEELYYTYFQHYCDHYGLCGAYGYCVSSEIPVCQCLKGFKHKSAEKSDWSQGCVRNKPLNNSKQDSFIKFARLKLPDTTHSWLNKTMDIKQCREKCSENSSCMAYTNADVRGGAAAV